MNAHEREMITAFHIHYIDVTPWFCSSRCSPIIDKYLVYLDSIHITATWALHLQNVLAESLGVPENATSTVWLAPTKN